MWVPLPVPFGLGNARQEPPRQRPASTWTTGTSDAEPAISRVLVGNQARQPRLAWLRLRAGGGSGECAQTPDAPQRKRPARPGSDTGNNVLPHKKRGGKLSGS